MRARYCASVLAMLVATCAASGCSDNKPAKITSTAPSGPVLDAKPFALQAVVANKEGKPLPGEKLTYSSNPSDVVSVSEAGECRCLKSGDATVLVSGGGLSSLVGVKCRLVSGVDAPREARLVVGEVASGFHAAALGEGGAPLADVPVELSSTDEHILRVENQMPVPVAVGKATLRTTAGGFTASTEVTVVQTIVSTPLLLNDGARQSWTLSAGNYDVEVKVAAAGNVRDGVTVAWLGSDCPNQSEKQLHQIHGHVADTSALTIENPTMLGMGAAVNGYVKIVRVP